MRQYFLPLLVFILILYLVLGGVVFWMLEKLEERSTGVRLHAAGNLSPAGNYSSPNCNEILREGLRGIMHEFNENSEKLYSGGDLADYIAVLLENVCQTPIENLETTPSAATSAAAVTTVATSVPVTSIKRNQYFKDFETRSNSTSLNGSLLLRSDRGSVHNNVEETVWDLAGSIFFAMTVVTTIGYGSLVPTTDGGRTFCCIYAMFGIPLCLIVLLHVGQRINRHWQSLDQKLDRRFRSRGLGANTRSAIIVSIGVALFVLIPSAVFSWLESWSYASSVYYCIITLSTTGFGDYVAGFRGTWRRPVVRAIYRLSVATWILLGLAWLAVILGSIQQFFQKVFQRFERSLDCDNEQSSAVEQPSCSVRNSQAVTHCTHCACAHKVTSSLENNEGGDKLGQETDANDAVLSEELIKLNPASES